MTTVLIVEDDPMNFRVFSKILTKRGGLEVKGTEDVEEVLQLAQSGEVDAILMDVALANSVYQGKSVDGIKITQILKANPKTASLPVILVTAHAMQGNRENFLKQSGADGYISKPVVDHQEFIQQIVSLVARRTAETQD
ncbi:MAG: response regulator [Pleurocapsa sp.]